MDHSSIGFLLPSFHSHYLESTLSTLPPETLPHVRDQLNSSFHAFGDTVGNTTIHFQELIRIATQTSLEHLSQWGHQMVHFVSAVAVWQVGVYWLLVFLMVAGVIGSFVPALPGVALVLLAVIMWGVATGFSGVTIPLLVAIAAFVLSIVIDNLAGLIGAQKVGASRWGQIGAIIGMGLGFFGLIPALPIGGPIFGIIFGTVLGAFVGEFLHRRDLELTPRTQQAFKVGIAIVVGNLVGNLLQGILALITLIVFVTNTWGALYS